jgi:hypothetical protein
MFFVLLAVVGFAFVLREEQKYFKKIGKGDSWRKLRFTGIPILIVSILSVVIPAVNTSGMEGLAVFYILAFTAFPVLWFGGHIVAGRWLSIKMSKSESVFVASSPLVYTIFAVIVAHQLQPIGWLVLGWLGYL